MALNCSLSAIVSVTELDDDARGLTTSGNLRGDGIGGIGIGQARHDQRRAGRDGARAIDDRHPGKPSSLLRAGSVSNPTTVQPRWTRLRAIAPPMMPGQ